MIALRRSGSEPLVRSLRQRMSRPQRHRLLHGFPMAPMLEPDPTGAPEIPPGDRPLLVGVLPHPFCNPTVEGCGFCTFPHERYHRSQAERLADAIAREIAWRAPALARRRVQAVYVGGGTANLLPSRAFGVIADALGAAFDLSAAEVTLEGAPAYFAVHDAALLGRIRDLAPRRLRISMGVQTFDPAWLARMGRLGFGAPGHVEEALAVAARFGAGTSCDLLVNLPGQPVEDMVADVRRAARLGFDQICVYPLVLRPDLPVPWASDPEMLALLPAPEAGYRAWVEVQTALWEAGYGPRTVTNHERLDLEPAEQFAYEPWSFRPDTCDGVGFGPAAISTFGLGTGRAVKWQAESSAGGWLARMEGSPRPVARRFDYTPHEDRLAVLTRRLCLRAWDDAPTVLRESFARELDVLRGAGLLGPGRGLSLTDRGVFFADSVAGLLAERAVQHRRAPPEDDDAVPHGMG